MKTRMDEVLGPVREQMADWGRRQQELWKGKSIEDQRDPDFQAQVKSARTSTAAT